MVRELITVATKHCRELNADDKTTYLLFVQFNRRAPMHHQQPYLSAAINKARAHQIRSVLVFRFYSAVKWASMIATNLFLCMVSNSF